jgi:transglutaminase-like putative cysteine protease
VRVSLTHTTTYRYSEAVQLEPHTFRLRPRDDASQRLIQYALSISPEPAGRSDCLDQDGNVVVDAWFDRPLETLTVLSAFTVETLRTNPFDFLLREYSAPLRTALAPYLREPAAGVRAFAERIAAGATHKLDFLAALNRHIADEFRFLARDTGAPNAADDTLSTHEGSCRDLAVLFCEAARAKGIASRFVSGYEFTMPRQNSQMHAWAEVYLEGGGWRGYDPSAGLAVSTGYAAVAAAADPLLAAPVTGTFRGTADARMEFAIQFQS